MINVRTVRAHSNAYGDKTNKAKGDEYPLPDNMAPTLIAAGLVEEVKAKAEKPVV